MDDLPQIRFSAKDCEGTARIVLTFSQEKRMLRHSLRIYSQTMSNRFRHPQDMDDVVKLLLNYVKLC